jgi:hypothetical protein
LQFSIKHNNFKVSDPYYILEKDRIKIMNFQDKQLAKEHYPELRLETNNIDDVFDKVSASHPHLIHPNLNKVTIRSGLLKNLLLQTSKLV